MSRGLDELLRAGLIFPVKVDLGPRRMPHRILYVSKDFGEWATTLSSDRRSKALQSERDELNTIFGEFIAGKKLANVLLDVNPPAGEGIKKLKTTSFRLWGWAHASQTLVLVLGARKADLASKAIREGSMGRRARDLRNAMGVREVASGTWYELFPARD